MSDFHKEREEESEKRLEEVKKDLPNFCEKFFVGISQTTTPLTRLNYAYELRLFFEFMDNEIKEVKDLEKIKPFDIELFISKTGNGERGKSRKLACLRTFFNYFYRRDELSNNVVTKVDMPKLHEKPIVRLEQSEMHELLDLVSDGNGLTRRQQVYHTYTSLRDTTIVIFFLATGIRISELVGLNVGDVDLEKGSFKVTRKGGNQTILYMPDQLREQLTLYLGWDQGDPDAPLFMSIQNNRIGVRAVQNLVKKYARLSVPLKNISPHKLRSTFGTNLYRSTKDIYIVADVLGHRDVNTTKKHYAAISEDVRQEAAKKVKI